MSEALMGPGGRQKKVLWTNSNQSATFSAQTIDVANITRYEWVFVRHKGLATDNSVRLLQGQVVTLGWTDTSVALKNSRVRTAKLNSDNTVTFSRCYYSNNSGHNDWSGYSDNDCIPYEIYALV